MGNKKMSTGKIVALGIAGFLLLVLIVGIIFAASIWNQRGEAVKYENKIDALLQTNKSDYDKMWKTFVEMTQVTELQAEQFKDVYIDLISGRNEDQNLLFKSVQESNPQLGTEVYTQLQRQIAADRATFNNNQKKILDVINQYNTYVEHKAIIMALITGRKPLDSSEYIVTSVKTDNAFESGQDENIDLKNGK